LAQNRILEVYTSFVTTLYCGFVSPLTVVLPIVVHSLS